MVRALKVGWALLLWASVSACVARDGFSPAHSSDPSSTDTTDTGGGGDTTCQSGYVLVGASCVDIDECAAGTASCDVHATCANTAGSYQCACDAGYTGTGASCTDVDECAAGTASCDVHATCTNTDGSYQCACNAGYTGSGTTCTDIDECATGTVTCAGHGTCVNTDGGYSCNCATGYVPSGALCLVSQDELISRGGSWRTSLLGVDEGTAWSAAAFDDTAWPQATALIGYNRTDITTNVSMQRVSDSSWIVTTYYRSHFNVTDPAVYQAAAIGLTADDGAIVYINGTEIARTDLPTTGVDWTTYAVNGLYYDSEYSVYRASFNPALLVAGDNVIAVEVHQVNNWSSADLAMDCSLIASRAPEVDWGGVPLVSRGEAWSYYDAGVDAAAGWQNAAFDDSTWNTGPAILGFGRSFVTTTISSSSYTVYFRHAFDVPDPTLYSGYVGAVLKDDGAVVYLNGTEVYRADMAAGTPTYATWAIGRTNGAGEQSVLTFPVTGIVAGTNVVAVEVHQYDAASSDLLFDLELRGVP